MSQYREINLGQLNVFESPQNRKLLDRTDSSIEFFRKVIREYAYPSTLQTTGRYLGRVLYVFNDLAGDKIADTFASSIQSSEIRKDIKVVQIIARIEELHAFIPMPEDIQDEDRIFMHPVFTAIDESIPVPEIDDIVYLDFRNKETLNHGIYLGTLVGTPGNIPNSFGGSSSTFGSGSASEAFDASKLNFGPLPPILSNFNKVKDVRSSGDPAVIARHDRFSDKKMQQLDTIVLHQTADSRNSNTNRPTLEAHIYIDRGGTAYHQFDFELYLATSHQFNSRPSVGIEIEGHLAGVIGAPKKRGLKNFTHWVPKGYYDHPTRSVPELMTPEQVEAAKQAIRYIAKYMQEKYGARIKFLGTHRQTYATKASDPGQDVMEKVALPMLSELGLQLFPGTLGSGRPNPEIWGGQIGIPYSGEFKATAASGWKKKTNENIA